MGASMQEVFDIFHGVDWREPAKSFLRKTKIACYARTLKQQRQVIMGHYSAAQIAFWRNHRLPIKAASMIREPVARFVSQYNYNISQRHPGHAAMLRRYPTMLDFAQDLDFDYQLNLLVGPFYSFDDALQKLISDFCFIGVVEEMQRSLSHFKNALGLPDIEERRINSAPAAIEDVVVDLEVRKIVTDRSSNDIRLYNILRDFYSPATRGQQNG